MKKKLVLLLLLITAVVVGRAQTKQDLLTVGTLAPDFTIANGNGKKALSLSDLRAKKATNGKVRHGVWTVLDFWASWCPDCRRDMPIVKQINEKFGKKIKLIGVSFDTDKEKMAKYLETNKYSLDAVFGIQEMERDKNLEGLPHLMDSDILLDRPGGQGGFRHDKDRGDAPET